MATFDPNNPFSGYTLGAQLSPEQIGFLRNYRQGNLYTAASGEGQNATPNESSMYDFYSPTEGRIAFNVTGGLPGQGDFGLNVHRNLGAAEKLNGQSLYQYDPTGRMTGQSTIRNTGRGGFMASNFGPLVPLTLPFAVGGLQAAGLLGGVNPVLAAEGAGSLGAAGGAAGAAGGVTVGGPMTTGMPVGTALPELGAAGAGGTAAMGAGAGGTLANAASTAGKAVANGFNWTDLIGPAVQLAGGAMGAKAAGDASDAMLTATREAAALQEPFRQGGISGMNRLLDLLGLSNNTRAAGYGSLMRDPTLADFQADPGYQFRQAEGEKALTRAASASGGLGSGKYLKDAMRFNQDLGSQEYGNWFNRFQSLRANKLNPLQALMGSGQTAANTIGEYTTQGGNASAAGKVGAANAWGNTLTQGVGMYNNARQNDQNNRFQNALMQRWGTYGN